MEVLHFDHMPDMRKPYLLLTFAGWSDAANVATGGGAFLVEDLQAEHFASIDPEEFYIFADHRTQKHAFQQHSEDAHDDHGADNAPEERQPDNVDQGNGDERAQHHDVALGEVDHLGGFVDQHESERNEAVHTTLRDSANE